MNLSRSLEHLGSDFRFGFNFGFKDIMVRSEIPPAALGPTLERQLHSLDPALALSEISSMDSHIEELTSDKRFTSIILTSFAILGMLLAVIGIYGVIAYLVVQRAQELGIRLALGAMPLDILWLILRQGLELALFSIGAGLLGVVLLSPILSSLLYGVSSLDGLTLATGSFVLLLVAILASAIPASRAMRINPIRTLRTE